MNCNSLTVQMPKNLRQRAIPQAAGTDNGPSSPPFGAPGYTALINLPSTRYSAATRPTFNRPRNTTSDRETLLPEWATKSPGGYGPVGTKAGEKSSPRCSDGGPKPQLNSPNADNCSQAAPSPASANSIQKQSRPPHWTSSRQGTPDTPAVEIPVTCAPLPNTSTFSSPHDARTSPGGRQTGGTSAQTRASRVESTNHPQIRPSSSLTSNRGGYAKVSVSGYTR